MSEQKKQSEKKNEWKSFFRFLKENKMVTVMLGVIAIVIIAAAILIGIIAGKTTRPASSKAAQETQETATEESAETAEGGQTAAVPLEEDAYPEVNALISEYYQAVADGDTEKIQSLVDSIDEENLIYLEKMGNYIESYNNLKCYTKKGPTDNSFVVYASYEVKFQDMDTMVPGVSPYLIYARDDGSYYIHEGEVDENVNLYLEEISAQDDVVDLMNRVQVAFNEAVVENEELNNYLAQMKEDLTIEVGEALAEAETGSESAQESQETAETGAEVIDAQEVRATDVVNVRASDSEQAEKIGKVQVGDVLPLLESKENGWSKVEYEGQEAYIKSEFLEAVTEEEEGVDSGESAEEDAGEESSAAGQSSSQGVSADIPSSGTVMVAETVNVRKSASETADKIGVCYQGGELEILMQQADGWTRVRFEGQIGYVKTDVLKVME